MPIRDKVADRFTYYPIPKNASTSIKYWLFQYYKSENISGYAGERVKAVHKHFPAPLKDGGKIRKNDLNTFKFAVVREPIKRFISAYKNRVLHHQCLGKVKERIIATNLNLHPGINEFIYHFEKYSEISKEIFHHCTPQYLFIGKIYKDLDKIYEISQIPELQNDLNELTGFDRPFGVRQTGGNQFEIDDLDEHSEQFLQKFLKQDFELREQLGFD